MMVLDYCRDGNLRNYYLNQQPEYNSKIYDLLAIAKGLMNIHNAGKVHKNFHPGNILFKSYYPYISDVGICQPANKGQSNKKGVYGILPYVAPEVLRDHQYTKESDIFSFGVIMNEFISEEIPYNDIPHDYILAEKVCKGFRPKIYKGTPKLFEDLIKQCWDAKAENRPTIKELYQILKKWDNEKLNIDSEIFSQVKEWKQIRENEYNNVSNKIKSKTLNIHSQAIYVSRLLDFQNLSEPINSSDLLSFQFNSGNV
jgi:serine/threonine protein kinase